MPETANSFGLHAVPLIPVGMGVAVLFALLTDGMDRDPTLILHGIGGAILGAALAGVRFVQEWRHGQVRHKGTFLEASTGAAATVLPGAAIGLALSLIEGWDPWKGLLFGSTQGAWLGFIHGSEEGFRVEWGALRETAASILRAASMDLATLASTFGAAGALALWLTGASPLMGGVVAASLGGGLAFNRNWIAWLTHKARKELFFEFRVLFGGSEG